MYSRIVSGKAKLMVWRLMADLWAS
jgi:hypothetical protein